MKKHKMEIAALTLLLGVLCYAFYDSNIKGSEQEVVLSNELLSMREIKSKEDITMEMLSLPTEELLKQQDEKYLLTMAYTYQDPHQSKPMLEYMLI